MPAWNWNRPNAKGDLAKAGELAYGVIPDLEKKLAEAGGCQFQWS